MIVDDGLEDNRWIRGLGGERLPAAPYALLPNLKKKKKTSFCYKYESQTDREFLSFVFCASGHLFLYQTPGRCPPRITGRVVNTVNRKWVGDFNERAPFRFHDAVVSLVDRYLSRTQDLAASN